MKKFLDKHIFILILTILLIRMPEIFCQNSPYDQELFHEASLIIEHIEIFTDRSIYAVNENIHFRADITTQGLPEGRKWSSVLYVELVRDDGTSLSRGKYDLKDETCIGNMQIPSGAMTGNYFLKSYTRWMRNSGPAEYRYTPLKIINPYNSNLANQPEEKEAGFHYSQPEYLNGHIKCSIPKWSFAREEEISFQLSVPFSAEFQTINCCITIVPLDAIDTLKGSLKIKDETFDGSEFKVGFLPDLNGPSISGTLVQSGVNDIAAPNKRLHFSVQGTLPDYFATTTDEYGKFVASLPDLNGVQELLVTPEVEDGIVEVRIDNDFDADFLPVPVVPFNLSTRESDVATQIVQMMQLNEIYNRKEHSEIESVPEMILFYGSAPYSIVLDEFIDLPTMKEVFINLVAPVTVVSRKGKTRLEIDSDNPTIKFFDPLVMIDQTPVFDHEKVLSVSPKKISRIDVINDIYVKGSLKYGGVINIVSSEGNMAGIDLPAGSYFFDYLTLHPGISGEERKQSPGDRLPDLRNTILWKPDVFLEKDTISDISFKAPAYPGEYMILIRGLSSQGRVHSECVRILVE